MESKSELRTNFKAKKAKKSEKIKKIKTKSRSVVWDRNHGQALLETVLLMVVLLGLSTMISKFFKDREFVAAFTIQPWDKLKGMIECGNWTACGVDSGGEHANSPTRILSLKPERHPR